MKLRAYLPILLLLTAAAAGLSCADIAAPSRTNVYEWRRIEVTGPTSADTLAFHWPQARLPVKIWAENAISLPAHVQHGIDQWKAAFLYGELDAVTVADSATADVIVRAGTPAPGVFSVVRLESLFAPECEGATDFQLPPGSREIQLPIRVFINPQFDPAAPGVDECLALTTTHELGHAFGIFAHSPVATDIMFADPTVPNLSARDIATAELAYHTPATLTIGAR